MKVAHVVLSLEPGGTERLVVDMATRLAGVMGVRVYCLDRAGDWAAHLSARGIPVDVIGRRPGFDLPLAFRLARLARAHGIDVLHCHQYTPFVYGRLAALATPGLLVVFTEHGRLSDAPPSWRRRVANLALGRLPGPMFAVSSELRAFMAAEGLPSARVAVIHNGIEPGPPPSADARRAARATLGIPESAFVIGTAARLDPVKNLPLAVAAFAEAMASHESARFVIVGDGPERNRIETAAAACGVERRIEWCGYRSDVRALLPAFDLYVNTSVMEGVSVTILEAMAAGLPVIATAVGGTPEIVRDGLEGALVPSRDGKAMAHWIRYYADHPSERTACGQAARARVIDAFTVERMVQQYVDVYRGLARRDGTVSDCPAGV